MYNNNVLFCLYLQTVASHKLTMSKLGQVFHPVFIIVLLYQTYTKSLTLSMIASLYMIHGTHFYRYHQVKYSQLVFQWAIYLLAYCESSIVNGQIHLGHFFACRFLTNWWGKIQGNDAIIVHKWLIPREENSCQKQITAIVQIFQNTEHCFLIVYRCGNSDEMGFFVLQNNINFSVLIQFSLSCPFR